MPSSGVLGSLFAVLLLIAAEPSPAPSISSPHVLPEVHLNSFLNIFKDCYIHIFTAHAIKSKEAALQNYHMEPKNVPAAHSVLYYRENSSANGLRLNCNGDRIQYKLEPNQGFRFNVSVPILTCNAQIYIAPVECTTWKYHAYREDADDYINDEYFVPRRYYDSVVDYRLKGMEKEVPRKVPVSRSGRFFIMCGNHQQLYVPAGVNPITFAYEQDTDVIQRIVMQTVLFTEISFVNKYDYNVAKIYHTQQRNLAEIRRKSKESCSHLDPTSRYYEHYGCFWNIYRRLSQYEYVELSSIFTLASFYLLNFNSPFIVIACKMCDEAPSQKQMTHRERKVGSSLYVTHWDNDNWFDHHMLSIVFPNSSITYSTSVDEAWLPYTYLIVHNTIHYFSYQLTFEGKGYHFVTCANVIQFGRLSFLGYVSAFDVNIWLLLIVLILVSGVYFKRVAGSIRKESKPIWFAIKLLLEQGTRIVHLPNMRIVGATWMLMGIVISNSYKGNNIRRLTSPIVNSKLDTFEKLIRSPKPFVYYCRNINSVMLRPVLAYPFLEDLAKVSRKDIQLYAFHVPSISQFYFNGSSPSMNILKNVNATLKIPENGKDLIEMESADYFLNTISKCKFDAYLDSYDNVFNMFVSLKQRFKGESNEPFVVMSKLSLPGTEEKRYWEFKGVYWASQYFEKRLNSFAQSHLPNWWSGWINRITTWNDTVKAHKFDDKKPKKLGLDDNTVVLFYSYLFLVPFPCLIFLTEIFRHEKFLHLLNGKEINKTLISLRRRANKFLAGSISTVKVGQTLEEVMSLPEEHAVVELLENTQRLQTRTCNENVFTVLKKNRETKNVG